MSTNGMNSSRVPLKILQAVPDKTFTNMLRLQFNEGGPIPGYLNGLYGSQAKAQKAIDGWVSGETRNKIYPRAPTNDPIPQRNPLAGLDTSLMAELGEALVKVDSLQESPAPSKGLKQSKKKVKVAKDGEEKRIS